MNWPSGFQVNAWAGPTVSNQSPVNRELRREFLRSSLPVRSDDHGPSLVDDAAWRNPRVGWGLVLPDDDSRTEAEKATLGPDDADALHSLVLKRGNAPIFRYRPDRPVGTLRRYFVDRAFQDISFQALNYGVGPGQLPRYMLIYGTPEQIPWSLQYDLQFSRFTGRIDLTGSALENYINGIVTDWVNVDPDPKAMTLWSVVHNSTDITRLMHDSIAAPMLRAILEFPEYTPKFLAKNEATHGALLEALETTSPAFVTTTSHGATLPLSDVPKMKSQLGLPVDQDHTLADQTAILSRWQPNGAIWYAHACCSAGSNGVSDFADYVSPDSSVASILQGVARCGSMTAPLPNALLGATKPLRAFVGHVEPTFNWTLKHPDTHQFLTKPILTSLFDRLYSGLPIGMALDECRRASATVTGSFNSAQSQAASGVDTSGTLLRMQLTAKDWDSMVLLGDPAVTLQPD